MALFGHRNVQATSVPKPPKESRDERVAACPYCSIALKKVPGAATKCPDCRETMYVRTDPRDRTRRVVTMVEAQHIDDETAKREGSWELVQKERKASDNARQALANEWNVAPNSIDAKDIEWRVLNEAAIAAMQQANWWDYLMIRTTMADALWRQGNFEDAAKLLISVCYWRLNGPRDMHPQGIDMSSVWAPFDPVLDAKAVSGELVGIHEAFKKLGVSVDEGLEKFSDEAQRDSARTPVPWSQAREFLRSCLSAT